MYPPRAQCQTAPSRVRLLPTSMCQPHWLWHIQRENMIDSKVQSIVVSPVCMLHNVTECREYSSLELASDTRCVCVFVCERQSFQWIPIRLYYQLWGADRNSIFHSFIHAFAISFVSISCDRTHTSQKYEFFPRHPLLRRRHRCRRVVSTWKSAHITT